jgi:hypothetical protein
MNDCGDWNRAEHERAQAVRDDHDPAARQAIGDDTHDEPERRKRKITKSFERANLKRRRVQRKDRDARKSEQRDGATKNAKRLAGPENVEVATLLLDTTAVQQASP